MNRFSATTHSEAVVAADRSEIWAALTDPELLPQLTPLLRRIDTDGDLWRWHLMRIAALGVSISPMFTERMTFVDGTLISYTHEAPAGVIERAGAEGRYQLSDVPGGTLLDIDLTLAVELPLPRAAGPAVNRVIRTTMERTGERFSVNLLAHLGVDASAT
jgi:carbon monoxide dehydrogenase subunit G